MSRTRTSHRFPYIVLGLLVLLPLFALAIPTPSTQASQPHIEKRQSCSGGECCFIGDDNTYGLGIRIGVYIQWITSAIAYRFIPGEAASLRGVNNCFQAAMFAGLIFITLKQKSDLHAVEAYIVLIFCMGGVCSGDTKTDDGFFEPKRYAYHHASRPGGIIRFLLSAGFCVYGVWFFFKGMDGMQHPSCGTSAFFFTKVDLYGWIRTFMKAVFLFMAIIHAFILFCAIISMFSGSSGSISDGTSKDEGIFGESKGASSGVSGFVLVSGSLVSFILTVEFMIRWNKIDGVGKLGSTGQLLPLIAAVGGLVRVVYNFLRGAPE